MGPIGASLAAGGVVVAAAVLLTNPTPSQPNGEPVQSKQSFTTTPSVEADVPAAVTQTTNEQSYRASPEFRGENSEKKRAVQVELEAARALRPRNQAARVVTTDPPITTARRSDAVRELESGPSPADLLRTNTVLASKRGRTAEHGAATDPLEPSEAVAPMEEQRALEETSSEITPPEPESSTEQKEVAAVAPDDPFVVEMRGITNAERLLSTEPARALAITSMLQKKFPFGYFAEERAYVEVMALLKLGRVREGRTKAREFLRAYPVGPYSQRVGNAAANGETDR